MKPSNATLSALSKAGALALCLVLSACAPEGERSTSGLGPYAAALGGDRAIGKYKVGRPYRIDGIWYYPKVDYDYVETGIASWYGPGFHGKKTANGEIYDQEALTAAHRTLPLPSLVRVTNLQNGRSLVVRLNDRGPFKRGRIIDLSKRSADLLGFTRQGTAKVRVEILEEESRTLAAVAQGLTLTAERPRAAPTIAVSAVPLEPPASETVSASAAPGPANGTVNGAAVPQAAGGATAQEDRIGPPRPPGLWRHRRAIARSEAAGAPTGVQLAALGDDQSPEIVADKNARPQFAALPWPDGEVVQERATPSNIYVQAGSFLRRDYATRLSRRLAIHGRSAVTQVQVGERWFFRVRLGPLEDVGHADRVLNALHSAGITDARIMVD